MKYFVAVLCLAQVVLSAPSEPTIVEQAAAALASAQSGATAAVAALSEKALSAAGVKTNEELLTNVQAQGEAYATQIKGVTDQLIEQAGEHKTQIDSFIGSIAKQISETAANFLGDQDPAKVEKLQRTFSNVLEQTNSLNAKLQEEGSAAQSSFGETLKKLYDNTLKAAKDIATQLDEQVKKQ